MSGDTLDRFEYQPMLDYLNDPAAQPPEMRKRLLHWAALALNRPLPDRFILGFQKDAQRIFDGCEKIQIRIPAPIYVRREQGEIVAGSVLRPRSMEFRFTPEYSAHFYYFALLISNPAGLARFSKCSYCSMFFIQSGRLRQGRCFCSNRCRQAFHDGQPDRRRANTEAVRRSRLYRRVLKFMRESWAFSPRNNCTWRDRMDVWNEEGAGRARANQITNAAVFKKLCQEAAKRSRRKP